MYSECPMHAHQHKLSYRRVHGGAAQRDMSRTGEHHSAVYVPIQPASAARVYTRRPGCCAPLFGAVYIVPRILSLQPYSDDTRAYDVHIIARMKLLSWNVAGLNRIVDEATRKCGSFRAWLDSLHTDVICFQEAKINEAALSSKEAAIEGYESFWAFSTSRKGQSGVVTYVRSSFSPLACSSTIFQDKELDEEGRCVVTDHGSFVVFNVYVPNAGDDADGRPRLQYKLRFLRALYSAMQAASTGAALPGAVAGASPFPSTTAAAQPASGKAVILCGDLNIAHGDWDVYAALRASDPVGHGYSEEELAWLDALFGVNNSTGEGAGAVQVLIDAGHACCSGKAEAVSPAVGASPALPPRLRMVDLWRASYPALAHPHAGVASSAAIPCMCTSSSGASSASLQGVPPREPVAAHRRFTVWAWRTDARSRNEGCRIDYIGLTTPAFCAAFGKARAGLQGSQLPVVESIESLTSLGQCAIVSTPRAWSDHVALVAVLDLPAPPAGHPPCPGSSKLNKKFKPAGANLRAMFASASGGGGPKASSTASHAAPEATQAQAESASAAPQLDDTKQHALPVTVLAAPAATVPSTTGTVHLSHPEAQAQAQPAVPAPVVRGPMAAFLAGQKRPAAEASATGTGQASAGVASSSTAAEKSTTGSDNHDGDGKDKGKKVKRSTVFG